MPRIHTLREVEFLEYFHRIDKRPIMEILSEFRSSTGPDGYATSLVLARILKVKERISSDRELSDKLAKIGIYREAIGIGRHEIPAHNTFHTLRQRLGPEGFIKILDDKAYYEKLVREGGEYVERSKPYVKEKYVRPDKGNK